LRQRGRKSAASLTVVTSVDPVETIPRPEPLPELTREQADVWRCVVGSMPGDWFAPETLPLLSQYVRHITASRRVAQLVERAEAADEFDVELYERVLRMQQKESREISLLAARMRISQHMSKTYAQARKPSRVLKPWDTD
jgi:hypothetical protein